MYRNYYNNILVFTVMCLIFEATITSSFLPCYWQHHITLLNWELLLAN